jgi:hypothetical protein
VSPRQKKHHFSNSHLRLLVTKACGNVSEVARRLGVPESTARLYLKRAGLDRWARKLRIDAQLQQL